MNETEPTLFRMDAAMREKVDALILELRTRARAQASPHDRKRDELIAAAFKRQIPFRPSLGCMVAWFRGQWEEYESKIKSSLPVSRARGVGIILSEAEKLGCAMVVIEPEGVVAPRGSMFDNL